ncbi:hypothetical protein Q6D67_18680 [Haliea sp. E1-2-M8]|uniref:DUF6946 family protein n=1 Tax=Haliea sp. E1-2-M8 TaxID=3064706 RepID=UPI0027181747|nr:hypothetical protein [Haliea sp. E1-2-M8]MDO8863722.1 hypothetical protein [Haliea sp. E1-2-M8]
MKRNNYCFDIKPVDGIEGLCERMTGKALRSPYRSTVPLLSLVEHSQPDWRSLLTSMGAPTDSTVYFEYCVASPKPGGNPSQTDALLISDSRVWAIEAKWREPRYDTVTKRIRNPESDGADPRTTVSGWLQYFRPFAKQDLCLDDFMDVVYQVLHRAASACAVATARHVLPELVYLHFHPSSLRNSATTDQYISDLRHLHKLLGNPAGLKFSVVEMPLEPTAAFEAIQGLDKTASESAEKVKAALCREPLFTFGKPVITAI